MGCLDGKELVHFLINLHALNGILIINVDLLRIPACFPAYADGISHKKVIVKNIRYVPLKDALYLCRSIIAVCKGLHLLHVRGQDLLHLLRYLLLCIGRLCHCLLGRIR